MGIKEILRKNQNETIRRFYSVVTIASILYIRNNSIVEVSTARRYGCAHIQVCHPKSVTLTACMIL